VVILLTKAEYLKATYAVLTRFGETVVMISKTKSQEISSYTCKKSAVLETTNISENFGFQLLS